METTITKPDNFPISSSVVILPNGCCINKKNSLDTAAAEYQVFDIEMITIESEGYTSLRDLLSTSPSSSRKNSWKEIPIKDPLVQHAAWAYLQPMATPEGDGRSFMEKLKDKCCGIIECFNDVVLVMVKGWFVGVREENEDQEEEDEVD